MFCGNCGAQISEGTAFCPHCGGKQTNNIPVAGTDENLSGKPKKRKWFIGVGAIAIIAIVLLVTFIGRSDTSIAKKAVKYMYTGEIVKLVKIMPDDLIDVLAEDDEYDSRKEFNDDVKDMEEEQKYFLEEYNIKYKSCKIIDEEEYGKKEVKAINERYEDEYGIDLNIKKAKSIIFEVNVAIDGETEKMELSVPLIKIGLMWYIDISIMNAYPFGY